MHQDATNGRRSIRNVLGQARNAVANVWYRMSGNPRIRHSRREDFLRALPPESVGLELGVFKGEYSERILQIVRPREFHLVDVWWTVFGEHYPNWGGYTDFGQLKTRSAYDQAMGRIEAYQAGRKVIVHVGDDLEYMATFPDGYFDWAYIDSSHQYEHTKQELAILKEKTKLEGLITGDDWHTDPNHIHYGVARAVAEFCKLYGWEMVMLDNYGQWAIRRRRSSSGSSKASKTA